MNAKAVPNQDRIDAIAAAAEKSKSKQELLGFINELFSMLDIDSLRDETKSEILRYMENCDITLSQASELAAVDLSKDIFTVKKLQRIIGMLLENNSKIEEKKPRKKNQRNKKTDKKQPATNDIFDNLPRAKKGPGNNGRNASPWTSQVAEISPGRKVQSGDLSYKIPKDYSGK